MNVSRYLLIASGVTFVGVSLIALSACSSRDTTNYMAKGYRYNDNTPLSSPAPTAPWKNERVLTNFDALASNTAGWQGAVYELVDGLDDFIPRDGTPIGFATWDDQKSPQKNALDHYLRQALLQRGIPLNTKDNSGAVIVYDVKSLASSDVLKMAQERTNYQPITGEDLRNVYLLTATVIDSNGQPIGEKFITAVLPDE